MSADNPDPSRYGVDGDGDFGMADFDERYDDAVADAKRGDAKKRELDRQLLQDGIDESGPPVLPRPQDAGAQRNRAALAGRGNAAGKQPARAQAPAAAAAAAADGNDSVSDSESDEEEGAAAQPPGPKGIVLGPVEEGDESESESDDDHVNPIDAAITAASNGSGNPGPSSSGGGGDTPASFQGAEHTVMVVCGAENDESLNDAQDEKYQEVMAALKKEDLSSVALKKAEQETKKWVHHCFFRRLPHYKCASRKLDSRERDQRAAQLQALQQGLDDPSNQGRAPTSYTLRNALPDINRLVQKTNHAWMRNPDDLNKAREALKGEYGEFMLEERCRILKVVERAREKRVTCEEAELDMEKDVEREYMDALLLEEAPLVSECNEARQFDSEGLKEPKGPLDYGVDELKDFTELLGKYIRNRMPGSKKRPGAGADDAVPKENFPPPGTPVPKMDMHQNTNCDVCEEWTMERKAWLAKTKEEMDDILKDPEYQAAMKRLFELRSELNGPALSWPGWPKALTTHFDNNEPLAKMVDTACPTQEGDEGWAKAQAAAKRPNAKPEQRRLLDEVIIRHSGGADGCGTKTVRKKHHTEFLLTEMLRCFPRNMQGETRLNPLLDFLCWYRQHITLAASPTPADSDGVTTRSLFFQALCAPTVLYKKKVVEGKQPAAGFDITAYPEVVQHKAIYVSIDTLYSRINEAAETAFAALVADLQVPEAESVLHRHNPELYAQWKATYYPQRS